MSLSVTLCDTEIATIFVLTEKSINDMKLFMKTADYYNLPEQYKNMQLDRLDRIQSIHTKLAEQLQKILSNEGNI